MSGTGISPFDETLQLSNRWLNELMEAVRWDDKYRSYRLLRATLHALRDRLPAHEAIHFGAQLPMLIRGLYYDGWHMTDQAPHERSKASFLSHIEAAFSRDPNEDTEGLVTEVFKLLARKISAGEIEDIKRVLPPELRELWPADKAVAAAKQPLSQRAFEEAEAYYEGSVD
jgi:uncharacterized protein (DUF2267 family)